MAPPRRAHGGAARWGPLLLAGLARGAVQQYSRIPASTFCSDFGLTNVQDSTECFGAAATFVSISAPTDVINDLFFDGCVFNTVSGKLMFGSSAIVVVVSSFEYICRGVPTTTFTTTTITTPPTTVTVTPSGQAYTLILQNQRCSDYLVQDVTSETECFTQAVPYVGLAGAVTTRLDFFGFSGCMLNTFNSEVVYGEQPGAPTTAPYFFRPICRGDATTTTTTSTVTITTVTTSTSTQTTSTQTTSTRTTSTVTTATSTATTSTVSTSTATTSTFTLTTSTKTATTSTASTSTHTGSTSTITTTTTTTDTSTTRTTTTRTTMTTTYSDPPWSGFVGDDPITFYKNVMRKFWLPEGRLVPLLRTPELQLLGVATTVGSEQYIKRLAIHGPANETVLQVAIRDGLDTFKSGDADSDAFETLNVTLGDWADGYHMASLPSKDAYAHRWQSLAFAFQRLADAQIGEARAEMAVVGGESATVLIMSVAAGDLEGQLAARHAHLDFVLQMKRRDTCEGILPEIWGVKPMSDHTLTLLDPPE